MLLPPKNIKTAQARSLHRKNIPILNIIGLALTEQDFCWTDSDYDDSDWSYDSA